jgi:acetoin utilization protein AcuB
MFVRDVMTTNVVTVSSSTVVPEAITIVRAHRIERLPVVDKGKLVGIVTKDTLLRASPSPATTLSVHELTYLLSKLTVREIMKKDVITISPDETVEAAVSKSFREGVGCSVVLEDDRVVGIVTSNDLMTKVLHPLMGIGETGQRIIVLNCGNADNIEKVMKCISNRGLKVKSTCTVKNPNNGENNLLVHLDTDDTSQIMADIEAAGFKSDIRRCL